MPTVPKRGDITLIWDVGRADPKSLEFMGENPTTKYEARSAAIDEVIERRNQPKAIQPIIAVVRIRSVI